MTPADRWMRRLTVGSVSGVAVTFLVTTAVTGQMTWTAWIAAGVLAGAGLRCLLAPVGPLRRRTAAVVTVAGALLPLLGSAGREPDQLGYGSGVWYVAGAFALVLLLVWGSRTAGGWVIVAVLLVHTTLWGGVNALASLGVLAMVILLAAVTAARAVIIDAEAVLDRSAATEQDAIDWRTLQEAFQQERQARLAATADTTAAMLHRIVDAGGRLSAVERLECRLLEQTVRDEIRGRRLLNSAVREQVLAHRRRGATVQINDDGGLDAEDPSEIDEMLLRVAGAIEGLESDRIIIRTLPADSSDAVSVVALTSDPLAAALGLDSDDDTVDLWLELPRPSSRRGTTV